MRAAPAPTRTRDLIALCKPGIVRMCLVTTLGGIWLAPRSADWLTVSAVLLGSAMAVAAAGAFNMALERLPDQKMARTADRPVAAGRVSVLTAVRFGFALSLASLVVLAAGTNLLTTVLAAAAIISYVLIYTPMKYRSPLALFVGAFPGAVPPLLGWTAVMGTVDPPGLVLAAILLVWQMPHSLAIVSRRVDDYARAGVRCVPVARGQAVTRVQATIWAAVLVPVSLLLAPLGVAGWLYFFGALALSLGYFFCAAWGFFRSSDGRWATVLFFASLLYLPALTVVLIVDALVA
ncbi:MAG: protoheme IX farnesyltransferase [Myxococcales bacterium FL481]|nr:MAG: protoheme IX farnesyltransferase [Myxococcales bacterium FL481]